MSHETPFESRNPDGSSNFPPSYDFIPGTMPTHTPGSSRASGCQPFSWFLVSYRNKRLRILRVHPGRTRRINSHFHILLLSTFSAREWGGGWEYWGALSWEALGQRGQFFAYDWRFAADVARRLRLQVYTHDGVLGADHDTNPAKKAAKNESERPWPKPPAHALPKPTTNGVFGAPHLPGWAD